jgi:putative addiction module CopG family antidote
MALTLDPAVEQRIQRELDRGIYNDTSDVVAHALDLLEAEEDWFRRNSAAINERLDSSFAQAARGDSYSPEEALRLLDERMAARKR